MLLAAEDPSPVRVLRETGTSDLFLTADHAGRVIPGSLKDLGVSETERQRHIAWDIGIAGVTERLSELLDATAVFQTYSRLVVDCNRDPSWPTAMPEVSEYTPIPGNENLSAQARQARVAEIFTPYHDRIRTLLDARANRRTLLVAMHSFTPSFKGESRAMQVGMLYNKDPRLALILLDLLRQEGDLTVGDNAPYAVTEDSDYGIPTHGEKRGLPHIEIEIRQDLIATPDGQQAWATRFARLLTTASSLLQSR
ncbi:MAG: N-formylglutamate amidohydrolase [Rhodopila sp.]|jgi:predicted N-formylglutamate amidohydrolase|nr:N-formylglutamate amidohydrolase [Rhodopila sp.]